MMSLYKILSTIWRNTFLKWKRKSELDRTYKQYCKFDLKRRKNRTYYIIRREEPFCGLAAYILHILADIDYAVKKGYVPIVDMAIVDYGMTGIVQWVNQQ